MFRRLRKGDILLTKAKTDGLTWWGVLIFLRTRSTYTHAQIYSGDGTVIEAIAGSTVREAPLPSKYMVLPMRLSNAQRDTLVAWAREQIGKPYSWWQFASAAFPNVKVLRYLAERDQGWICTALAAAGCAVVGEPLGNSVVFTPIGLYQAWRRTNFAQSSASHTQPI